MATGRPTNDERRTKTVTPPPAIVQYHFNVVVPEGLPEGTLLPALARKLEEWAIEATRQIRRKYADRLRQGGDPRWAPLAEETVKARRQKGDRGPLHPLYQSGSLAAAVGRFELQAAFVKQSEGLSLWTQMEPVPEPGSGPRSEITEDQFFGRDEMGPGYDSHIPARPLVLTDEMAREAVHSLQDLLRREYGLEAKVHLTAWQGRRI